ncbi:Protein of unknown function [Gryllus bimaculatus]|nr:Protein of unknown function [Gryllus bimaculatus]
MGQKRVSLHTVETQGTFLQFLVNVCRVSRNDVRHRCLRVFNASSVEKQTRWCDGLAEDVPAVNNVNI